MSAPPGIGKPRRSYGLFSLAAVAYVACVAAFAFWSYQEGQEALLNYAGRLEAGRTQLGSRLAAADPTEEMLREHAARSLLAGVVLLALAAPLAVLYHRAQSRTARELATLNYRLQQDVDVQRRRESELKDAMRDLERFATVATGRESRIMELKTEVNALMAELDRPPRYNIDRTD